MPAVSQFPIKKLLSQFNKCEKLETKRGDVSDGGTPVAVVSLVVALLALLLAIKSYRRSRSNRPAPTLSPSPFIKPFEQAPKTLRPNRSATIPSF